MSARERIAYLKGLLDGQKTPVSPTQSALLAALKALGDELDDLRRQTEERTEDCRELYSLFDGLDAQVDELAEHFEETDGEPNADELDQEFEEACCTSCGTHFFYHPSLIEDGAVRCPGCDAPVAVMAEAPEDE